MQNNICPECNTENEPQYKYCKNCGAPLINSDTVLGRCDVAPANQSQNSENNASSVNINGNSTDEMFAFVGKNASKIVPDFIRIDQTGSKVRWCWPPFILGFFLGPIGVAIWFLYRKMYSFAALFGAVSVFVNYVLFALRMVFAIDDTVLNAFDNYVNDFVKSGRFNYQEFLSLFANGKYQLYVFINSAFSALGIACAVLAGIFGIYIYKRHSEKSIAYVKSTVKDSNYMGFAISAKGGTSVGAAILGTLVISFASNLPETVYGILGLLKLAEGYYGL